MLRSTGFFRGVECPLAGCNRPYCHFRHSRPPAGLGGSKRTRETPAGSNDQGYDPFSPEVVRPGDQYNAEASDASAGSALDPGAMELELVNRAIEAVRSEMEKDKKKLSQIGDQGYEPANSSVKAGYKRQVASSSSSHNAYDPGSYQMGQASDYNPTPRSSKYTLDSETGNHANSMEYVPTAVSKPGVKKAPAATSRVPATLPASSSSKCKYTLDNSKPPTDMEYDPLLNFSAKPVSKSGKEVDGRKRTHPAGWEKQSTDEEYVPTVKKPRQILQSTPDPPKYTASFTESDEESSGTEYRPTLVSRLKCRKSSVGSMEENSRRSVADGSGAHKQPQEPATGGFESDFDTEEAKDKLPDKKVSGHSGQAKSKVEKTKKESKDSVKKSSSSHKEKKGSSHVEKPSKKSIQENVKKEKNHGKTMEEKVRSKERDSDGACKEGKEGRSKKLEKVRGEKERVGGDAKRAKTDKLDQSKKNSSKYKEQKNGKLESGGQRDKDKKRNSSSSSNNSSSKDKSKKSNSSLEAKVPKAKPRSLSHADLFGDESPEEEEEEEDDDEEDERIVRKSASAFKRGALISNNRKASEAAAFSSEDDGPEDEGEGDDDVDHGDEDEDEDVDDSAVDYAALQTDVDYDSDPMEECLRIFNESKDVKTEDKGRQAKQPPKEEQEDQDADSTLTTLFPGQKKRVSHFKAKGNEETSLNVLPKPQRRLTAQEVCYQRMQIAQQQAVQLAAAVKTASASSGSTPSSAFSGEKRRVMHRPNPSLISAKPGLADAQRAGRGVLSPTRTVPDQLSVKAHTSAGMLSKTVSTSAAKRVAHTPTLKSSSMKRPVIPTEFGAKVPTNVRQRYLNVFIDECLKFCPSEEVAFQMGLDEEKLVYDRSSSKNIYLNVAVNTLKKLRSKCLAAPSPTTKKTGVSVNKKVQSHEGVLGGRLAATTSYTINRLGKQQDMDLKGAVLYRKLKPYVLTEEQLQEHSYPRPHPERLGHAVIYNLPEKKNNDPFSKVCCRCGAEYKINALGSCVRKEECSHHWGRLRRYRVPGGWETQYSCCSGAVGSPGCQVAKQHVQDGRKESLDSYVKTFSKPVPADGNGGVYALDCEMCYTKQGLELTRVTVINSDLKVVYDTFVKPESKVVDYNTRFSGVTEEDLENATMRLRDVQAVLLNMFSAESILIGHSLESDLLALKLLHSMVVDTAVVFPHRLGLPYKRALRNLMADYLKRIIQDNVEGHDSSEDASACMELMIWKIKEDAKVKR
ncbi:RNA exonuclease 1 homolog [Pygocentrus nattereri]|uniref:Exonuclease domain-containing protein n=1 Tax=Pygocentrus nattereri TaxID=42514 RepID=A0A3B4EJI1_PYGNA|nr:RNA exonuclease 1 homolog [Pygocentrus nattereri]